MTTPKSIAMLVLPFPVAVPGIKLPCPRQAAGRENGGRMPSIEVNGGEIAYEILGDGPPIVLTPGGRFSMNVPGLRPLAEALAPRMKVLLWDRPNSGASDVKFTGDTESNMHADDLAELLRPLDMRPA